MKKVPVLRILAAVLLLAWVLSVRVDLFFVCRIPLDDPAVEENLRSCMGYRVEVVCRAGEITGGCGAEPETEEDLRELLRAMRSVTNFRKGAWLAELKLCRVPWWYPKHGITRWERVGRMLSPERHPWVGLFHPR